MHMYILYTYACTHVCLYVCIYISMTNTYFSWGVDAYTYIDIYTYILEYMLMYICGAAAMYIRIHISLAKVTRAIFVSCVHVYMYPYLNDKSQPRHFCLVTAVSHMHIGMYLRIYVYMCLYLHDKSQPRHFCLVTAASHMHIRMYVHMRGSCDKTKVARLTRYWAVASIVM